MLVSKILLDVNSATHNPDNPDQGLIAEAYNNFTEDFKAAIMGSWHDITKEIHDGLISFGESIIRGLVHILAPVVENGAKSLLVYCFVIYYCTDGKDTKSVRTGITAIIVFILFEYLKGVVL